jgi:hypothetical protein
MFTPGSRGCGYKTVSGRHEWPNRDPIQEAGGLNLYEMTDNNPVNEVDALGLYYGNPVSGPNGPVGPSSPYGSGGGNYPNGYLYPTYSDSLSAFGVSFEISTINPFTSGGGGAYGFNLEYTSCNGVALYRYNTPNSTPSMGFLLGPSVTFNAATGTGPWTGLFDAYAASYDVITAGTFQSSPAGTGYSGFQIGFGKGPPGAGATQTDYHQLSGKK